jgi:hypothetical protein
MTSLARDWPELLPTYERLYVRGAYAPPAVVADVKAQVAAMRDRHGIKDRRLIKVEPVAVPAVDVPIGALVPAPGQLALQWPGAD